MITEDYVSVETGKLLREKGFDESTFGYYVEDKDRLYFDRFSDKWNRHVGYIAAPTLQMAHKWLKEKYNLYIEVYVVKNYCKKELEYVYTIQDLNFPGSDDGIECVKSYSSSEEASEAAIKYCLEKLI